MTTERSGTRIIRPASRRRRFVWCAFALALAGTMAGLSGCSRPFWRTQADRDSYALLEEKLSDPLWQIPRCDIQPDPASRFYDPYDPDCGPLPPDDPAAHEFMHCAGGFAGSNTWHQLGRAFSVENPHWLAAFDLSAEGDANGEGAGPRIEEMTLNQAIELSYIHSREYQTAIEQVYLTSLDLTFERFQFAVRYLGFGGEPSAGLIHESIPHGENSLRFTPRFGISQLLPTGGQWIVELANNTLWLFSGGNQTNSASVLSYSLVQPLLMGAGRKVVLESLTQGERDLLYAVRDLARFRQEFFVDTVAAGPAGGFLGLLQQRQSVLNQQGNISRLNERLERERSITSRKSAEVKLDALPPGLEFPEELRRHIEYSEREKQLRWRGEMSAAQERQLRELSADPAWGVLVSQMADQLESDTATLSVLQLQSQLASSEGQLRTAERRYQDLLDQFKVHLGLPPDLPVTIDESLLDQFALIDARLTALEQEVRDFVGQWTGLDVERPDPAAMRKILEGLAALKEKVRTEGFPLLEDDFRRVEQAMPERLARLETDAQRMQVQSDVARDRRLYDNLKRDMERVQSGLEEARKAVGAAPAPAERRLPDAARGEADRELGMLRDLREQILKICQSLQVIQIGLRTELISIEPYEISMEQSLANALEYRVDLMNALARVTDARRQVEIAANRLEAVLDVVVEGDVRTPVGTRPFDFRGDQSSFRAGLRFTAPLDQVAERNAYRAAQIRFQRARREYMAFEDRVKSEIRTSHRQLTVLRQNFETARQAVRISALEYDSAVEQASAPLQQGGQSAINLLRALDNVLNAQNGLIQTWVQYEQSRLNIYRDMGMMDVDADGVWNDRLYRQSADSTQQPNIIPPVPPGEAAASRFTSELSTAEIRPSNREPEQRAHDTPHSIRVAQPAAVGPVSDDAGLLTLEEEGEASAPDSAMDRGGGGVGRGRSRAVELDVAAETGGDEIP